MFCTGTNRESDDVGSEGSFEEPDNDLIDEPEKEYIDDNNVFDEYCNDISADLEPDNTLTFETTAPRHMLALVKWICLFLLHLQAAYRVSNAAVNCILRFFSALFRVLATFSDQLVELAKTFPKSLHLAIKFIGQQIVFTRYTVCRKCFSIYPPEQRLVRYKKYSFKKYPQHPQRRMRQECGTLLLKTVEKAGRKQIYYPSLFMVILVCS